MANRQIATLNDGCNPELVYGAKYDGTLEIPIIEAPKHIIIPSGITPFSEIGRHLDHSEAIGFYEKDEMFSDLLIHPDNYIKTFQEFSVLISPDCSQYRNAPLAAQVINLYRSRALGSYFQRKGVYVIPQVRWGNELTYTTIYFPEKIAFLGIEKHGIVAIGTYGCIQSREDKRCFRSGLRAMLYELEPIVILVYGPMPESVFGEFISLSHFVQYDDWITRVHKGRRSE